MQKKRVSPKKQKSSKKRVSPKKQKSSKKRVSPKNKKGGAEINPDELVKQINRLWSAMQFLEAKVRAQIWSIILSSPTEAEFRVLKKDFEKTEAIFKDELDKLLKS
jgi:hypothetical protein